MANNYRQFSAALGGLTKEEADWAKSRLEFLDSDAVDELENAEEETEKLQAMGYGEYDSMAKFIDFDWAVEAPEPGKDDWSVWFYAEEWGNVEHVATFVQEFFLKHRPKGVFTLTYADWCSKLRVGEFSGGSVVVTAEKVDYMDSSDWANKQLEKWLAEGKVPS